MTSAGSASNRFGILPDAQIQRSTFDRSSTHKTTLNAGELIPVYVDEGLPGDTFRMSASVFARLATPIKPIMDGLYIDVHFFAVPARILWENWERFMGAQDNPGDSTDYVIPVIEDHTWTAGSLGDYFGIPTDVRTTGVNALPFRAYLQIYRDWYRDQNVDISGAINTDDGPDLVADYYLRRRKKRLDYFTGCLPWPQKGPTVYLPLGSTAAVATLEAVGQPARVYKKDDDTLRLLDSNLTYVDIGNVNASGGTLFADLENATAATVNEVREAFQIQRLQERDARGGTRLIEIVRNHFGVVSEDARMQRAEFLGGGTVNISVNPVTQTAPENATVSTPQGNLAAVGTGMSGRIGFTKSFSEHVYILGIASVRSDITYQQGLNKMWSRSTKYDFYWPGLAHLGEQAVLQQELFYESVAGANTNDAVFGYQERWAEYRYRPSQVTGLFRSNHAQSLDIWHLSQEFASPPTLNTTFMREDPPMDRIKAVTSEPDFLLDAYFNLKCARPMPVYSVPGLIDHF